ncbi:MAG TPA: hypothetical protein VHE37_05855 [Nevskiaceae bacterium]|nr:hypothetical protein [Nevskiaceae bacterium]
MLSKTAYDVLPYAYFGAAVLDVALLHSPLKYVPAVLLVLAGVMVISWRKAAREKQRRRTAQKAASRHAHLTPWPG